MWPQSVQPYQMVRLAALPTMIPQFCTRTGPVITMPEQLQIKEPALIPCKV